FRQTYTYDGLVRLVGTFKTDPNGDPLESISYSYDARSNLTQEVQTIYDPAGSDALVLEYASVRRGKKTSPVRLRGTLDGPPDASAGITLHASDGASTVVTAVLDASACATKRGGKIVCRTKQPHPVEIALSPVRHGETFRFQARLKGVT